MTKNILVVEEDKEFIAKLAAIPSIFNLPIHIETNFESALNYLENQPCAIVIQEIILSSKINMDLIKHVKMQSNAINFETSIAIMNANMSPEYAATMKQKLSGVIHKPFEVSTFVQIVKLIIAFDYLKKLLSALQSVQEKVDITSISGVTEQITEAINRIRGFLLEDEAFNPIECSEIIEELLTMIIGEPAIQEESKQYIKGLEVIAEEAFQVLGDSSIESISKQNISGILEVDENFINIKNSQSEPEQLQKITGTTEVIKEGKYKVSGNGEGNSKEELILVKGDNLKKAEEMMEEGESLSGDEPFIYTARSEIEKLKVDVLDRQNKKGQTYCLLAAGEGLLGEVKKVVEDGANLTLRCHDGLGLLHYACKGGNLELVQYFIEKKVDYKSKDNAGNIPLVYAIQSKNLEMVKLIGEKMHNLRYANNLGESLATEAAKSAAPEVLKWLLNKGAPINLKDNKGRSAFYFAKKAKCKKSLEILSKNGLKS